MDREALYARLPHFAQDLASSAEGYRLNRVRYSRSWPRVLAGYEERAGWTEAAVREYRDARLVAFLSHAAATVPFYRDAFRSLHIDIGHGWGEITERDLPTLSRDVVREDPSKFVSDEVSRRECLTSHTSGTTGAGLNFPVTVQAHREQWAVWWRYRGYHGITRGTWCSYFGGRSLVPLSQTRPPYWRYNIPGRQVLFSAYHLNRETAPIYLAKMQSSRAPWIHGYPSVLSVLASFALEAGFDLQGIRWVTTGGENLLPVQARLIRSAFGVAPIEHYGMAEGVANFSTCPLRSLHVDEDFAGVEFVPRGDGSFRVIGTNFTNLAFPLIRYEVGDAVTLSDEPCPCGRPGRIVATVDGREEDYLVLSDGTRLGRLDHVFKDQVNIRQAQVKQDRKGEATVWVVRGARFCTADEQALRAELYKRVGRGLRFEIRYCDNLARTAAGKLPLVVSSVARLTSPGRRADA